MILLALVYISQYIPWCLHTPILIRRFRLDLWIPWRHFWNKIQVLQHLKEQDFKSCVMPREILSLSECPTPSRYVRHTLGRFTTHSAHDIWSSFSNELPFPVFVWWHNLVGNISWYNSYMAAKVWVGTVLQLFIQAKHPPLSRAESCYLFLVSFPCYFSSPSVPQYAFCCALARMVLSFFPPISSLSSEVALG